MSLLNIKNQIKGIIFVVSFFISILLQISAFPITEQFRSRGHHHLFRRLLQNRQAIIDGTLVIIGVPPNPFPYFAEEELNSQVLAAESHKLQAVLLDEEEVAQANTDESQNIFALNKKIKNG
ncbi:hypothetical protein G9A89_009220 [Geosiphon pyriformis]|nr:hypothetical protein G9A89_009220 [Geosiphon pyriformis]